MRHLAVSIAPRKHPYRTNDGRWDDELWGTIIIEADDGQPIVDTDWDPTEFLAWFVANFAALKEERLSIEGDGPKVGESLAQALDRYDLALGRIADVDPSAAEARYEQLRGYRLRHQINSGFQGSLVEAWVVGPNHGGSEMSLNSDRHVSIQIDIDAFLEAICSSGTWFLESSIDQGLPTAAELRARRVLDELTDQCRGGQAPRAAEIE